MKRIVSILIAFALAFSAAQAERLEKIRLGYYPERIRAVFDFNSIFTYSPEESKEKITLHFPNAEASRDIPSYVEVNDVIVRYFEVEKEGNGLKITIPLGEPIPYNIFALTDPYRLIVDFDRDFTNLTSGGTIIDGVEALTVNKGTQNGRVVAQVLKVDPTRADLSPALAKKHKPNTLTSFADVLTPWSNQEEEKSDQHFFRATVGKIAEEQGAVAAINGTYFAYNGKPLGTLLIDKELVSTPIYDRTALILSDDGKAFVDNIQIECYFNSPANERFDITGVNQGIGNNSIIMYTPVWGEKTGTARGGVELTVVNSKVASIGLANSTIPQNGYVLSTTGTVSQFITDKFKIGDPVDLRIRVIPYVSSPSSILHLVSGGPRLVKEGQVYVSKHEENFRPDIAKSRAARSAVGITKDNKILLVTVDGLPRQKKSRSEKSSIGMTLEELAELMINLGAVEAMNLDGGGSTTMWIDGKTVNRPVNGGASPVSNALVIRPKY
ncbi:hypothetical protein A3K48_04870 [candidate division WOR-1 bacterium RIFOXYA12_FULL_52_29]|uniref:Phosphodiester glycosidase domain-containing protein n=1 Tax=candidate division WOR-1 bacterium RIFOXYC12_FULL_54_18 TaxID=1802584 RepID=A0A1F4T6S1_UNCSA|nr:MAG: hypothetical protein A3K44_04870 [candidate division WOR-1 bacterium RIFOXYA2_FULL_51_19]OGC17879.1 MAG: hypothetical protein A3K48_04870 [candidate division WOR-1 bacterium RIFOXYA12_FULL_52_29]OGC26735.1 MAG: hypothetical protein A3K32_04865 [candidate division WOR-1 bacterium RIFOXYB2_FULL_45_9]OGC28296.1 MAG: hypothetical protein A3K49_04870 [candidate division WOR-1 bacterium RIFOXYC12_FULL_54_18]OGC31247.1 MAG: hypothetical protein A2346_07750 [candidate division WOR-1 bacterium R